MTANSPTTAADASPTTGAEIATTGDATTAAVECVTVSDCPGEACRVPVDCVAGACVFADMPNGTPLAEQTPGDCAAIVCDGFGGAGVQVDPGDLPDDKVTCTADGCDGLVPVHTPLQGACYSGPPATLGIGACVAGVHTCDVSTGEFGPCMGEVGPGVEDCDAEHRDDDCDGVADESGASCMCGDGIVSDGEACDDGDEIDDACSPTCEQQAVFEVSQGSWHGCARLTGELVKCWGLNNTGQLGQGDTEVRGDEPGEMGDDLGAVNLGSGQVAMGLSAGEFFTCALLATGRIKCWGINGSGELGVGDTKWRGDQPGEMGDALPHVDLGMGVTASAISAGAVHACALLTDGRIKCWGNNQLGQLGHSSDKYVVGDEPGEMGDDLPIVDLGPGVTAVAVSAGWTHTCALVMNGGVKCWGENTVGQLGLGDTENRGDGPGEMGAALPFVDLGGPATALSAGSHQTCVLLQGGKIKCWGFNALGQLGLGDPNPRGVSPGEMGAALPVVDLGAGKSATSVHTHKGYTYAHLSDGTVKCWGANGNGQLGLGDTENRGDEPGEMGDNLPVLDLGAGVSVASLMTSAHTGAGCALLTDGAIKCWGMNIYGELGLGDKGARGDEPGEMGDALPRLRLFSSSW